MAGNEFSEVSLYPSMSCVLSCSYGDEEAELAEGDLRPRARTRLQWDQLQDGGVVMVNHNFDHPKERGFWYDAEVARKEDARREKKLFCKIRLG